ncbi:MAG: accessory factor UbiK family protein [Pseudomonadota bacterium]
MQTRSTLFDDLAKLMTNAAGMAQGMREEAETALRSSFERWLRESSIVSEEEFSAVREMALKAREENAALEARIAELEAKLAKKR